MPLTTILPEEAGFSFRVDKTFACQVAHPTANCSKSIEDIERSKRSRAQNMTIPDSTLLVNYDYPDYPWKHCRTNHQLATGIPCRCHAILISRLISFYKGKPWFPSFIYCQSRNVTSRWSFPVAEMNSHELPGVQSSKMMSAGPISGSASVMNHIPITATTLMVKS